MVAVKAAVSRVCCQRHAAFVSAYPSLLCDAVASDASNSYHQKRNLRIFFGLAFLFCPLYLSQCGSFLSWRGYLMDSVDDESWFVATMRRIEGGAVEYGPTVSVALAGIGWTFAKDFITKAPTDETWIHFWARICIALVLSFVGMLGAILAYKRSGSIRNLKSEVVSLKSNLEQTQEQLVMLVKNSSEAWRARLAIIKSDMGLDDNFRLSIYRYSHVNKTFRMLGRYSAITKYNEVGRGVYAADTGCIGAAWQNVSKEAIVDDLPLDEDEYIDINCKNWGFKPETVRNLTMKSRSVYAFAIMDSLNINRTAIIVFESTDQKAADSDRLRVAINETYRKQIISDLEMLKFIEPSPELASQRGF